ncbi:MAG: hypothetical protein HKN34_09155 [Gammaproteobacteria bacterium]|nr:hypothetical protein [Gammaproteobacteria bacterium]
MTIIRLFPYFIFYMLPLSIANAGEIPSSVVDECSTNPKIYYPTRIRVNANVTPEQKTAAVMDALTGLWIYENDTMDAIYAGYHVKRHYLRFAIVLTDQGLTTIICDSENMKQREASIHRKAPQWKEALNSRIRTKISTVSRDLKSNKIYLNNLTELRRKGFVTKDEYETIKERIPTE